VESLDMTNQELLKSALRHHHAGRMADAESSYRKILAQEPDHPDALNLLGMLAHQCGNHTTAERLIGQAIAVRPNEASYRFNLGLTLMAQNKLDESIAAYRRTVALKPDWAEAHNNLGTVLQERGYVDQAVESFNRALELQPGNADFHYNLGNSLLRLERMDEAATKFRDAIALRPNYAAAYSNLADVLCTLNRMPEALTAAQEAVRLRPEYPDALNNLGSILFCLERMDEAIVAFERAIAIQPNFVDAHNNLGNALNGIGKFEKAVSAYQRALALEPNRVDILCNLSGALRSDKQFDAALEAVRQAVALRPDDPSTWQAVAAVHSANEELDEAVTAYRQALARAPTSHAAHTDLGNALMTAGRLTEAIDCYDHAAELGPNDFVAASNRLFTLQFHPDYDAQRQLAEHRIWDQKYAGALRDAIAPHANDRSPDRRLKIGYVSPDFREHCQALFTEPLLANHDHEHFEIFCYSAVVRPDAITNRLKSYADVWRSTRGMADAAIADLVREDGIDILVDMTMHMANCRPLLMARKPAPVQVAWLAYPGTTGMATMDYRLTDPYLDPENLHDDRYSERSIRLPDTFWCYDPRAMEADSSPGGEPMPEPGPLPASLKGYVTFGCLNNFCKVNDAVLERWTRIMREVDRSRLRLLAPNGQARQRTRDRIAEFGVSGERIDFVARQSRRAYLREFDHIDICLDTLPYNGHTTSLDSFWMGVPVVTQVGNTVVGRAGLSQLSNLKLTELAATSEDDFVQLAVEWSRDLPRLAELRRTLRPRMLASPLCDGKRFARSIESAFRTMWRQWCVAPTG
jgi:protein O-GlcNAc transferase